MKTLTLIFFAEFAVLALAAPLAGWRRTVKGKLAQALLGPLVLALVLVVLVRMGVWPAEILGEKTVLLVLKLQAVAAGFALAVTGVGAFLARGRPTGGSLAAAVLALAVLATPFWGDVLLNLPLPRETVAGPVLTALVAANPLFTVTDMLQYDWMHSAVLYGRLSRIGEDFLPPSSGWLPLAAIYGGVGLLLALGSALVRERGRPSAYLPAPGERK